jgi:hypothetical protein
MQTRTHKTRHSSDLEEDTTFPFIVYFALLHKAHIQIVFFLLKLPNQSLEITKIGTPMTLRGYNFVCRALIEMRSKEKL